MYDDISIKVIVFANHKCFIFLENIAQKQAFFFLTRWDIFTQQGIDC